MIFTWTMLFARSKRLIDCGDFYGFMLFFCVVIDSGMCLALLAKFAGQP